MRWREAFSFVEDCDCKATKVLYGCGTSASYSLLASPVLSCAPARRAQHKCTDQNYSRALVKLFILHSS